MKAIVLYNAKKIKLEEVPIPDIQEDEVLVKVKNTGICGSDLAYYYGKSPIGTQNGKGPLILGHEISGEVEKIGSIPGKLKLFSYKEKVVINPIQNCNFCEDCSKGNINTCSNPTLIGINSNGGLAEYCVSKYSSLYKLPENINFSVGAFIEPIACAFQGLDKLSVSLDQFIVIIGSGPIGIILAKLIRKAGAGKILMIDKHDFRLEKAREFGADYIFNIKDVNSKYFEEDILKRIKILSKGNYADGSIVASGTNEALDLAINTIGNKGKLVIFGLFNNNCFLNVPVLRFLTMNQEIRSSWCAPYSWPKAIQYASNNLKDFKKLLTHFYKLEETEKAIQDLSIYSDNQIKIQIVF